VWLQAKISPKTLIKQDRAGQVGTAKAELANRRLQPLGHVSGKAYQALSTHSERTKPEIGTELAPDC